MTKQKYTIRSLIIALGAIGLFGFSSMAYAAEIEIQPTFLNSGESFSDGRLADGISLFPFTVRVENVTSYDISAECGTVVSSVDPNQEISSFVGQPNYDHNFYLRTIKISFYDENGNFISDPILNSNCDQAPYASTINVDRGAEHAEAIIPLYFPTGSNVTVNRFEQSVPAAGEYLAVIDGDGEATSKVETSQIMLNTPSAIQAPPGTRVLAKLIPDGSGVTGTLTSTAGTSTNKYPVDEVRGVASFLINAPIITNGIDIENTLVVWTEIGDAVSTDVFKIRFMSPGYIGSAMLELPFENDMGFFSVQSRGNDPLTGSTDFDDSYKVSGVHEWGVKRSGSERLYFKSIESFMGSTGTLSMWIRPESRTVTQSLISETYANGTYLGDPNINLSIDSSNRILFKFGSSSVIQSRPIRFSNTEYHHIAATWSINQIILYMDGYEVARTAGSTAAVSGSRYLSIGHNGNVNSGYVGDMDELMIFTEELSPEQVLIIGKELTGQLNTDMHMFSTIGFESESILRDMRDIDEINDNQCDDSSETFGAYSDKCINNLNSKPVAPVRVVQCVDTSLPDNPVVDCDPGDTNQQNQTDPLYLASVGAQQFGHIRVSSLNVNKTTDAVRIPHPGFPLVPSLTPVRFASPISTRFRMPPKMVPDLVICNYPALAGESFDLSRLVNDNDPPESYVFEKKDENTYGEVFGIDGDMANRFICARTIDDPDDIANLNTLRDNYTFVLRDNTGAVLERDWEFMFERKTDIDKNDGNPYGFEIALHEPLNDQGDQSIFVTDMIRNMYNPDGSPAPGQRSTLLDDGPLFNVTTSTGMFDVTIPAEYTRTAAMTILNPNIEELSEVDGYAEMVDVVILFKAPSGSSTDTSAYYRTDPFTVDFEINPNSPSFECDPDLDYDNGECLDNLQLQLTQLGSFINEPANDNITIKGFGDSPGMMDIKGFAHSGVRPLTRVDIAMRLLVDNEDDGNHLDGSYWDWNNSFISSDNSLSLTVGNGISSVNESKYLWSALSGGVSNQGGVAPSFPNRNGLYMIYVRAYDDLGKPQLSPAIRRVYIDRSAP